MSPWALSDRRRCVHPRRKNFWGPGLSDPEALRRGLDALAAATNPITDIRGTREYRLAMAKALARDAIRVAWERGNATHWGRP